MLLAMPALGAELARRQATINGLVVRELGNGKFTGMAVGIIATATKDTDGGEVVILGAIGDDMKSALKEAERYVRVNHPDLGGARIEVSFEERYSPKDGGSAGTAFALLLGSLAEGYEIDPAVAITGEIAVNGKVQPIGGVNAKLVGAAADGCSIGIVPKDNVPALADLFVDRDRTKNLGMLQVFSVETVDDAVQVVRKDRDQAIIDAMTEYTAVMDIIGRSGVNMLRNPKLQQKLEHVLELAPNHVMAQYALDIGRGKAPRYYTRTRSVINTFSAASQFWFVVTDNRSISRNYLPKPVMQQMLDELKAQEPYTHPEVQALRKSMYLWIDAVNRLLDVDRINERDWQIVQSRKSSILTELKRLDTDEELIEKMMREGY